MNTTDPELDQLLETFARKVWDPQQSEFEYRIQENKYPKFRAAIQSWAAKQELRGRNKLLNKLERLYSPVRKPSSKGAMELTYEAKQYNRFAEDLGKFITIERKKYTRIQQELDNV